MSRERRNRRESITAQLAQFDREDEEHWQATKASLDAIHAAYSPLAVAEGQHQVDEAMAEVARFNRHQMLQEYREADPERMAYHLLEVAAKAVLTGS